MPKLEENLTNEQYENKSSDNLVSLAVKRESIASKLVDKVKRLVRNDGKADEINQEIMVSIKAQLHEKAAELAEEHGLTCARIMDDFDSNSCDVNLKFSIVNLLGQDIFSLNLLTRSEKYGLHASVLGRKFQIKDSECMVTGLDDTDRKEPLIRLLTATDEGNVSVMVPLSKIKKAIK